MDHNGHSVGVNAAATKRQALGSFKIDYFADGADLTKTKADVLADLVAAGTITLDFGDGSPQQALTAADLMVRLQLSLKGITGEAMVGGVKRTATTADATYTENGIDVDVDGGGSKSDGLHNGGFWMDNDFGGFTLLDGGIVTLSGTVGTVPA